MLLCPKNIQFGYPCFVILRPSTEHSRGRRVLRAHIRRADAYKNSSYQRSGVALVIDQKLFHFLRHFQGGGNGSRNIKSGKRGENSYE